MGQVRADLGRSAGFRPLSPAAREKGAVNRPARRGPAISGRKTEGVWSDCGRWIKSSSTAIDRLLPPVTGIKAETLAGSRSRRGSPRVAAGRRGGVRADAELMPTLRMALARRLELGSVDPVCDGAGRGEVTEVTPGSPARV
jgi:hypothetical protein